MKGHSTKLSIIFTLLLFSVTACDLFDNNSRPSFPVPVSCHNDDYNQYVYDVMKRFYYWYDEVDPFNQIDPKDTVAYPDPQSLLDVLKFSSLDRFSSIGNAESFSQFYGDGIFLGVGLRLLTDELSGDLMVAYAFQGSPAYNSGIRRGDRIVEINDYAANGLMGADWDTAWGAKEVGTEVNLLIEHADLSTETILVSKALVSIKTTQNSGILTSNNSNIGYLSFTNFLNNTAINDLNTEFDKFKANNISELIVDLRYNGGGSVNTAKYLASLIGGEKTSGEVFSRLIFNNKPNGYNGRQETTTFQSLSNALSLNRVVFITTGASCSASELVINALLPDPEIEVIIVGSGTCGKPVGSVPDIQCSKALSVINFEIINSANQGGYFDGINSGYDGLSAFCTANDDLSALLGSQNETSIATALSYLQNNQCEVQVKSKTDRNLKTLSRSATQTRLIYDELY